MATGSPDWQGLRWKTEVTQRPSLIYPSGKVFFIDAFNEPTLYWDETSINGASTAIQTEHVFQGSAALKISLAAVNNSTTELVKRLGLPESKKMGLETTFTVPDSTDGEIGIRLIYYDGETAHYAQVRWLDDGDKWQYYSDTPAYADVSDGAQDFYRNPNSWQHMKLVADFDSDEYVSFKVNQKTYDLDAASLYTVGHDRKPTLQVVFLVKVTTGEAEEVCFDNVVVTEE